MAWKKVASYSYGFKPSDKKYWLYYTLEGSNTVTQVFLTATQFTAVAALLNASTTVEYETVGNYFSSGVRTL